MGVTTRADAQLSPLLDEGKLFTGLTFAEQRRELQIGRAHV